MTKTIFEKFVSFLSIIYKNLYRNSKTIAKIQKIAA